MAAPAPQSGSQFCPDCGEFVNVLNEQTGFCAKCTPSAPSDIRIDRIERWLSRYADLIESTMQEQHISAKQAIAYVISTHKAICVICHTMIKHGTYGRHFICSSTPACKKARRRYKYLIYEKGLTKEDALQKVIPTNGN